MKNELIVKSKTTITKDTSKKDIFSFYDVPTLLDEIIKKEKKNVLNNINPSITFLDSLNELSDNDFEVEIPAELREMLKTGEATLDKSRKNPGSFTCNIRKKGEKGINAQVTIAQKTDSQAITRSLSNLAMMAMTQSVLNKLDVIEEKIEDIGIGQKDDRIGIVIGSFKGFMDLYHTYTTKKELEYAANIAYINMQCGLAQIHKHLDTIRKKLNYAPSNNLEAIWKALKPYNASERYQKYYMDYIYDIQLYNRLIILSDVVLYLMGNIDTIRRNHQTMVNYLNEFFNETFKKKMNYLMNSHTTDISELVNYHANFEDTLKNVLTQDIKIECKATDYKLFNIDNNGSKKH